MATKAWIKQMQLSAVRQILRISKEDIVVLDTETTGISHAEDGFVQIALINKKGETMFNSLINPEIPINKKAYKVHGISSDDVANSPKFYEVYPTICDCIRGKTVLIYNATFDSSMFMHQVEKYDLPVCLVYAWEDLMVLASALSGQWNTQRRSFTFVSLAKITKILRLPEYDAHDALADCNATLNVFNAMHSIGIDSIS